jgi:hypothetical protein
MLAISATAIVQIWDAPLRARQFPLLVATPMLFVALYQLAADLRPGRPSAETPRLSGEDDQAADGDIPPEPIARVDMWRAVAWFVGFFVGVWALGFPLAIPLYTFLYLRAAGERLALSLGPALAAWGFFELLFVRLLHIPLFTGQLLRAVSTP